MTSQPSAAESESGENSDLEPRPQCGLAMPISAIDGCDESHWQEVREMLTESIEEAGLEARLVSESDESGILHTRIVNNLYDNPLVVCDISAKNPNVMFELGLRLAFNKPTIVVKDDKTDYSFDTSPIEHLGYPRSLRYRDVFAFKQALADKVRNTYHRSLSDPNYSTFLSHFKRISPVVIESDLGDKISLPESEGNQFYLSWPIVLSLLERVNRESERNFGPDVVVTMSGPGSFAACKRMCMGTRDIPLLVAVTFPRPSDGSTNPDCAAFEPLASRNNWIHIRSSRWEVFLPSILRDMDTGSKVLVLDDRVLSGETQFTARKSLQELGLNVRLGALVAPSAVADRIDFVGKVEDGEYLFPWGHSSGRTA